MVPTAKRVKRKDGDEFGTPKWVWEPWHRVLHFVLDAAASPSNVIPPAKKYYTKNVDAFKQDWAKDVRELGGGAVWLNPPYSRAGGPISRWVMKSLNEAANGVVVCMLLPADTSTSWFSLVWDRMAGSFKEGVHGCFTDCRVKFIDPVTKEKTPGSPNFGSLILVLDRGISSWLPTIAGDSLPSLSASRDHS